MGSQHQLREGSPIYSKSSITKLVGHGDQGPHLAAGAMEARGNRAVT